MHKIIRPHLVGLLRPDPFTATRQRALGFPNFFYHLQLFPPPHSLDPLAIDPPPFRPQQLRHDPVTIRRMFPAQSLDPPLQPTGRSTRPGLAIKRRLRQTQSPTGPIHRTLPPFDQIARRAPPSRRAYHFFEFTSSKS